MNKQTLRKDLLERRKNRFEELKGHHNIGDEIQWTQQSAVRLWQTLCHMMAWQSPHDWQGVSIASYMSLKTEMPTQSWHDLVARKGAVNCLPVASYDQRFGEGRVALPLQFYDWGLDNPLMPDATKTLAPVVCDESVAVIPCAVVIPLVGFDNGGYRLGMGGGFYDRTLALLKRHDPDIPFIGYAYDCQYVDCVPVEPFDMPLDAVVTETQTYVFDGV